MSNASLRKIALASVCVVVIGVSAVLMAAGKPASQPTSQPASVWKEMFSEGLQDANGQAVELSALKGKLVAIYFSAHWCPPCREFTPKLVEFRDKNAADLEVVFVSSDRSQEEKDKYIAGEKMKWLTVPFRGESSKALTKRFEVRGIPTLVVLSPGGKLVSATARADVTNSADKCIAEWKKAAAEADKAK